MILRSPVSIDNVVTPASLYQILLFAVEAQVEPEKLTAAFCLEKRLPAKLLVLDSARAHDHGASGAQQL